MSPHLDGLQRGFRASWQTRFWYLAEMPIKDTADMLKLLGITKEQLPGAMALITLMRKPPE